MAITYRIIVDNLAPLDGVTPLPANAKQLLQSLPAEGIQEIRLTALNFGRFNPGDLLEGQTGSYLVSHLQVTSEGGPHVAGSQVRVRAPALPNAAFGPERTVVDFGNAGLPDGVLPEGFMPPVPVGHEIIFDTTPDGPNTGPHVIQITLEAARLEQQMTQRQMGTEGGGGGGGDSEFATFVYRPGGVPGGNVFTSWPALVAEVGLVAGPKIVEIDDSIIAPAPAIIPAGTYNMNGSILRGRPGSQQTVLRGGDGTAGSAVRLTQLFRIEQNLQLQNHHPTQALVALNDSQYFDVADGASLASLDAAPVVQFTGPGAAVVRLQEAMVQNLGLGPAVGLAGGVGASLFLEVYDGTVIDTETIESDVGSILTVWLRDFGANVSRVHALLLGTVTYGTIAGTGTAVPTEDGSFDLGDEDTRWRNIFSRMDVRVAGSTGGGFNPPTLTFQPSAVGKINALTVGYSTGLTEIYCNPATNWHNVEARVANFNPTLDGAALVRQANGTGFVRGSVYMYGGGAGEEALIDAGDAAFYAFVGGLARVSYVDESARIRNLPGGGTAFIWSAVETYTPGGSPYIYNSGRNNVVFLLVQQEGRVLARDGTSLFQGSVGADDVGQYALMETYQYAFGSFLQGRVSSSPGFDAIMRVEDDCGWASGRIAGGTIRTGTGQAATARGFTQNDGQIYAEGHGSLAWGWAAAGQTIGVTANNSEQWGVGVNAMADSTRWGVALRVKKTLGPPAVPVNGDVWQTVTGDIIIHSGGADRNITNTP